MGVHLMTSLTRVLAFTASLALGASTGCAALGNSPAQSSGPIKIGMVTSLTGNYAPLGTNDKLAVQQGVDGVNAKNGINGRKVELNSVDDGAEPNHTVIQVNKGVGAGAVGALVP